LAGAIAAFRQAISLNPNSSTAYNNLGTALADRRDFKRAIAAYQKALALNPTFALAHCNLGDVLKETGALDGAIAAYQKAIALEPKDAVAHYNLGVVLATKEDLAGAVAQFKKAISLDPKDAKPHSNLGLALQAQGDLPGAIAACKKAIALDPKFALAHCNLGSALTAQGDLAGAIAEFNQAMALDPKSPHAHGALGQALLAQGRFAEARSATRKALQLLPPTHPFRQVATQQLRQCEQWLKLDAKLPAFLKGEAQPADAAEQLALANLCQHHKQRYTAAARFYTTAFSTDAQLASDLRWQHRYNAACAAALAAAGKGEDAAKLEAKERTRLRKQALDWLQADLAAWTKVAAKESAPATAAVRRTLEHWQKDRDLAGLRDAAALGKLPAEEQKVWRKLWAEVAAVLKKSQEEST
jgi:Flp pilus assembly protein TadD